MFAEKSIADGRSPTERLQPWLIAGLSIVLLSMAMISTWMVVALSKAAELRVDSYRHLAALSQVVSLLRDVEAIQRSYLIAGNEKYANFLGHWAPTFLLLGVYNKLVKQHGSDAFERQRAA